MPSPMGTMKALLLSGIWPFENNKDVSSHNSHGFASILFK
jgi:hypothetical protein